MFVEVEMSLLHMLEMIESKEDLARFVKALQSDLHEHPDDWKNPTLEGFLSAMNGWIEDMDGYYRNNGQQPPQAPTWRTIAEILSASRIYE